MAKEFKLYDRKYAQLQGTLMSWELAYYTYDTIHLHTQDVKRWEHKVSTWSRDEIREAVYEAEDRESWQEFRVSLKGWSTEVKLVRLKQYEEHCIETACWCEIEKCRIDNYIGALVRGGFLKAGTYEVLK